MVNDNMTDVISRQQAIDVIENYPHGNVWNVESMNEMVDRINGLLPSQPEISYIISETLHECGIYGEEATVKLIGTLKRLRRDDLLPPCVR